MANYFVPLQAPRPRNAMLDLSPINQGLDSIGQANQQAKRNAMLQQSQDLQQREFDARQAQITRQNRRQDREMYGKQAYAVDQEQDPQRRAALWRRITAGFDQSTLSPEELDPITGPKLMMAQAGLVVDPLERQMAQAKLANLQADTAGKIRANQAIGTSPYKDPKQLYDVESGLRKEYASAAKPFIEVRDAYNRVVQSAKSPSPAGDLALIFNYMKMLDPGSVVREGEFATAQNSAGVPERIRAWYNRVISGERLTDATRGDFVSQARGLYDTQQKQYGRLQDQYRGISERSGVNPKNTILDYRGQAEIDGVLSEAKDAIARGAPREAVIQRLKENGIDPAGL